jgi:hypothetical protein
MIAKSTQSLLVNVLVNHSLSHLSTFKTFVVLTLVLPFFLVENTFLWDLATEIWSGECSPSFWFEVQVSVDSAHCLAPILRKKRNAANLKSDNQTRRSQWPSCLRRGSAAGLLLGSRVRIPPGAWIFVCCECCVLSGRGVWNGPIPRPEECYRLWLCDCVWSHERITLYT